MLRGGAAAFAAVLQHGHYTAKANGMQAVRQFVPPNTLRWATLSDSLCTYWLRLAIRLLYSLTHARTYHSLRYQGDFPLHAQA